GGPTVPDCAGGSVAGRGGGVVAGGSVGGGGRPRRGRGRGGPPAGVPVPADLLGTSDPEAELRESLRQNLRLKFMYDEGRIDQAIAVERERNPKAGDIELMQAAIYRWERENR